MTPSSNTVRKRIAERYFEGFRRSDHQAILGLLTDDVVWEIVGYSRHEGKAAFDREIENENFVGSPTLTVERLVEGGDTVMATGLGAGALKAGGDFHFAFCTVLTFSGDKIRRVESYVIPLK